MLTQICQYLRNWFDHDSAHNRLSRWSGTFTISGGKLQGFEDKLKDGQYFRIIDSDLNDGVHNTADVLKDETFTGVIQSMRIPPDIIQLAEDIAAWLDSEDVQKAVNSPYQSESFGGYSYALKSNNSGSSDNGLTGMSWTTQKQFYDRLAPWRKI